MINTYKNITVTRMHKVIINNIPLKAGEIVDVIIVPKSSELSQIDLPLSAYAVELNEPFESVVEEKTWEVLN